MSESDECTCAKGTGFRAGIRVGSGMLVQGPDGEHGLRAHLELKREEEDHTSQIVLDAREWADLIAGMTNMALTIGGPFREAYEQRMRHQRHMFN